MKGLKAKIRKYKATRWILILTNWVSQGIWHMDKTEQIYKIFFTLFFTFVSYFILSFFLNINSNIFLGILSFIISHTINWIVNGNLYTLFVHRLLIGETKKEDFFSYLEDLKKRVESEDSIRAIYCYGSMSRGELKEKSDLDISFLREKGLTNAIKSILFFTKEKKIAQSIKIPSESFLCDEISCFKKRYSINESPIVVYDKYNITERYYKKYLDINEAKTLNNVI